MAVTGLGAAAIGFTVTVTGVRVGEGQDGGFTIQERITWPLPTCTPEANIGLVNEPVHDEPPPPLPAPQLVPAAPPPP